jgi:hypothetical protein
LDPFAGSPFSQREKIWGTPGLWPGLLLCSLNICSLNQVTQPLALYPSQQDKSQICTFCLDLPAPECTSNCFSDPSTWRLCQLSEDGAIHGITSHFLITSPITLFSVVKNPRVLQSDYTMFQLLK